MAQRRTQRSCTMYWRQRGLPPHATGSVVASALAPPAQGSPWTSGVGAQRAAGPSSERHCAAHRLKSRLGAFYKNMPIKEYKFLMNNQSELSLQDLKDLLMNNEVTNFDPVAEAFKAYDPENTGFVDQDVLRNVFENLGFGQITDDDMKILLETGDVDQDGRISLEDFRNMIEVDAGEPL